MDRDLPVVRIELNQGEDREVLSQIGMGEFRCIFNLTGESFSVRRLVPLVAKDSDGLGAYFEVEFLTPEEAVAHFHAGTIFTVWSGQIVGSGNVVGSGMKFGQGGDV